MRHTDLFYLLALQKVEGIGDITAKKLLQRFGNAEEIFRTKTSKLASIDGIGTILLKNLKDKSVFEKAECELKFIEQNQIQVYSFLEDSFPEKLRHCIDSPILMFGSGNM